MDLNILKRINYQKNNGKSIMLLLIVVLESLVIIFVFVKNVEKNTLDIILAVIDIVPCAKIILVRNGFKKNLVIYLTLNIFILLLLFHMN